MIVALVFGQSTAPRFSNPEALIQAFVRVANRRLLTADDSRRFFAAEIAQSPLPKVPAGSLSVRRVVTQGAKAAASVTLRLPNEPIYSLYFHMANRKGWQITAFRRLALTGLVYEHRDNLRRSGRDTPELRRLNLFLADDATIIRWFRNHEREMNALARSRATTHPVFSSLERDSRGTRFIIGEVVDNANGFHYVRDGKPPALDPSGNIWVERLSPNWFYVVTT